MATDTHPQNHPLVYSCSGCSSAAQLANHVALRLDRAGVAEMSCIAGVGGDEVIEHHHIAAHVHLMGYPARHPNGALRRHDPIAEVSEHFQRAGGRIGELPAPVGMPWKHRTGRVLAQRHHRFGAVGFVRGISEGRRHGPILSKYDLT